MASFAVEPEEPPDPAVVAPIQKKKSKTKSAHLVRDKEEVEPSQQEEEAGPEIITLPLFPGVLAWVLGDRGREGL